MLARCVAGITGRLLFGGQGDQAVGFFAPRLLSRFLGYPLSLQAGRFLGGATLRFALSCRSFFGCPGGSASFALLSLPFALGLAAREVGIV